VAHENIISLLLPGTVTTQNVNYVNLLVKTWTDCAENSSSEVINSVRYSHIK